MAIKEFHKIIEAASRLDLFLREELPLFLKKNNMPDKISNSKVRRFIISGAVTVNNRQVRLPSFSLNKGDKVSAFVDEHKIFFEKQPDDIHFELTPEDVLFEDDYIILVNKPAFFPTEATIVGNRDNLHDAVVRYLWNKNPSLRNPPYVGIMHRLDRETSGVILFTKQRSVNTAIHEMFDSNIKINASKANQPENSFHSVQKTYIAVCEYSDVHCGVKMKAKPGLKFSVEMEMGRISSKSQAAKWGRLSKENGGVFSHTDFKILGVTENNVLKIEARPLTGRTHQIRVHLASQGLPIKGDKLYGSKTECRVMLHSASLEFIHPVSGDLMKITAPLPEGF